MAKMEMFGSMVLVSEDVFGGEEINVKSRL